MRRQVLVIASVICGLAVSGMTAMSSVSPAFATARQAEAKYPSSSPPPPPAANLPVQELHGFDAATTRSRIWFFSYAHQQASSLGGWGVVTVAIPYVAPSDALSGAFTASESRNGSQWIEVGWRIDPKYYHDSKPHLFIDNNVRSCQNACGYVSRNAKYHPGIKLPLGPREFGIEQRRGAWWIGYNGKWIGYYPDSLWHGKYKKAGLVQWYGWVKASSASPCTDMGNGQWASSPSAARFLALGFFHGPAVHFRTSATNPALYSVRTVSSTSFRFGGGGAC